MSLCKPQSRQDRKEIKKILRDLGVLRGKNIFIIG